MDDILLHHPPAAFGMSSCADVTSRLPVFRRTEEQTRGSRPARCFLFTRAFGSALTAGAHVRFNWCWRCVGHSKRSCSCSMSSLVLGTTLCTLPSRRPCTKLHMRGNSSGNACSNHSQDHGGLQVPTSECSRFPAKAFRHCSSKKLFLASSLQTGGLAVSLTLKLSFACRSPSTVALQTHGSSLRECVCAWWCCVLCVVLCCATKLHL